MDYTKETIAAIATPIGVGGIGIIRISGATAERIARKVFRPKRPADSFENFRLYLGHIIDPQSNLPVDEVLLSVMRSPSSYTREDVVEVNSHSGYAVLSNILRIILKEGAQLAKPGEFTLRAFLNGRIDLTQAEAIVDLIGAKGEVPAQLATNQLIGGFKTRIAEMKQALIGVLAQIEAVIDFPDEESLVIRRGDLTNCINERIITPISDLITAFSQRKLWHEGVSVAIVGRVNVGKSSILNRLLRKEKAIVTPIPGTTRDILEDMLTINGLPLKLIDTAGIRKVKGMVEKKGVDLTKTQLSLAHLILLVIDQSRPLNRYDLELIREVDKNNTIVIFNKIDLPARVQKVKITTCFKDLPGVKVSALTGDGFDALIKTIFDKVTGKQPGISSAVFLPNLRHNILLEKAARFLESATQNLVDGLPLELVATDLSWVKDTLDEITGYKINEEVLDKIFSDFCLGK